MYYPQKYASLAKDYFELIILRNHRHKGSSEKCRNSPFVREIHIRKGDCTRKRTITREHYFIRYTYLHGRIKFVYQTFPLLTFPWTAFLLLKPQTPTLFLSCVLHDNQLPGCLLNLIPLWGSCTYVHNNNLYTFSLM